MIFTLNALGLMFFFVLGAIIGSFLNVVIFRYGTGRSVGGRSACLSCATRLKWYHMVPVLSYLILRGRCAKCRTKISSQYVIVEFLTAVLFTLIAYSFFSFLVDGLVWTFFGWFSLYAFIASCTVVITVYDIRHMIIPDSFVYAWIAAGVFIQSLIIFSVSFNNVSVLDILSGPILFLFFGSLWYFSNGTAMGFGDAKLGLAIGLTLGFSRGLTSVILGFWIGAVFGIILMILSKFKRIHNKIGLRTEVPFGPFLILGFFLSLFLNLDLVWMINLFAF